jgi:hypothetical protein
MKYCRRFWNQRHLLSEVHGVTVKAFLISVHRLEFEIARKHSNSESGHASVFSDGRKTLTLLCPLKKLTSVTGRYFLVSRIANEGRSPNDKRF